VIDLISVVGDYRLKFACFYKIEHQQRRKHLLEINIVKKLEFTNS